MMHSFPVYLLSTISTSNPFAHLLYAWFQGRDVWVWFMFVYVLVPNTYMVYSLTAVQLQKRDNQSTPAMIFSNLRKDVRLMILTCLHLSNFLFFIFVWLSMYFLYWAGNDRVQYGLYSWKDACITIHLVLQWTSMRHLREIMSCEYMSICEYFSQKHPL